MLLLISLTPAALSATIATCAPSLLLLTPCAPFVQGSGQTPTQICCDNLNQVYDQKPDCICLLFNNTAVTSLPINTTLALQLPLLCSLQIKSSTCLGGNATTCSKQGGDATICSELGGNATHCSILGGNATINSKLASIEAIKAKIGGKGTHFSDPFPSTAAIPSFSGVKGSKLGVLKPGENAAAGFSVVVASWLNPNRRLFDLLEAGEREEGG